MFRFDLWMPSSQDSSHFVLSCYCFCHLHCGANIGFNRYSETWCPTCCMWGLGKQGKTKFLPCNMLLSYWGTVFLPMLSLYSCSGIVRHMDGLQSCWLGQGCIATRDESQVDTWIFNHANMGCTMELLLGPKPLLQPEMVICKLQPGLSTGRLHCTAYRLTVMNTWKSRTPWTSKEVICLTLIQRQTLQKPTKVVARNPISLSIYLHCSW